MPKPSSPNPHSDRELLRLIERSPAHRAGYKQLIRELGLGGGRERRLLLEQLARITLRGDLVKLDTGQWALPHATPEKTARAPRADAAISTAPEQRITRDRLVAGKLDLHRDGFGFVRPNGSSSREDDLFIPPTELNGAMQGDEVIVEEAPPGRPGADGKARRSGRVLRVLTRRNPTVVGIFHYARPQGRRGHEFLPHSTANYNYVTPLDERMTLPVLIPDGPDGEVILPPAQTEHRVIGDEARRLSLPDSTSSSLPSSAPPPLSPSAPSPLPSSAPPPLSYSAPPPLSSFAEGGGSASASTSTTSTTPTLEHKVDPLEGLAVDIEITEFPTVAKPARGRIIEVLGHPDDFGVDVEIVIRKHHLPYAFPANVLAEAADSATHTVATLSDEELALRHDFRGLPIVTIDGATARDFDDAVLVQPLPNGNWQLQVHIADVSHYVLPGTALDLEARLRGTSVYFPDRAVPMLPPALSSGMCSLRPDEDRLVLSCISEIDQDGEVVEFQLCEGIIRSARRMTYTDVQKILDGDAETRAANIELVPHFEQMHALALLLNQKRHRRGSIDFDLPEPVIEFDPQGNMAAITRSERGWSNRLIEEFMLTANECVAHWLEAQTLQPLSNFAENTQPPLSSFAEATQPPLSSFAEGGGSASASPLLAGSIYRIHELPDPRRILDFEETASTYGQSIGFSSLPVKKFTMKTDRRSAYAKAERHGGRTRAPQQHEVPESIPVTPQMYQRLTAKIAGTPEERILSFLMLRSLKQARYSEKNEGHFALASSSYTHFTSPIRRYPDLIVHRLLRHALRSGANTHGGAILSTDPQPWSGGSRGKRRSSDAPAAEQGTRKWTPLRKRRAKAGSIEEDEVSTQNAEPLGKISAGTEETATPQPPILPLEELAAIALESSQAERRADDAERELMEWKKIKFMQDRVGEDFWATILSCTRYGFFVELDELFIEGLVPIQTLSYSGAFGDQERFVFRDTDRAIVGASSGRVFRLGQRVHVLLDRIDRPARRLQFALVPPSLSDPAPQGEAPRSLRKPKAPQPERAHTSPTRTGKPGRTKAKAAKARSKKSKGKRR